MKLKAIPLIDVEDQNDFRYATEVSSTAGDPVDLYFQLSDAEKQLAQHGFNPSGLRYMPKAGSTLQVIFLNVNTRKQFNRFASQPFTQDPSVWKVSVLATDPLSGTVSIKFILTEPNGVGGITKTCSLNACFLVDGPEAVGNPRPESPWGF